jgi:hypothetical protein
VRGPKRLTTHVGQFLVSVPAGGGEVELSLTTAASTHVGLYVFESHGDERVRSVRVAV